MPATGQIMSPCYQQAVHSAAPPTDPCHDTLPGANRVRCLCIARVCAGGSSCSESVVGTTVFASGRSLLTCWSLPCSGDARVRRSGFAATPCTWLTVRHAHGLGLFYWQRLCNMASSRKLQWLRRAAPDHEPNAQLVSLVVRAVCAYAERYREHPRSGSYDRCSGTECPDLRGSPQILSAGFRHGFEVYRPKTNFCQQDSNYLRQGPEI